MNQKQGKTSLNYSHVKIIKIPQEVIKNKDSLITLDISGSNFKNFSSIIEDLKKLKKLKNLKINIFNQEQAKNIIEALPNLEYLNNEAINDNLSQENSNEEKKEVEEKIIINIPLVKLVDKTFESVFKNLYQFYNMNKSKEKDFNNIIEEFNSFGKKLKLSKNNLEILNNDETKKKLELYNYLSDKLNIIKEEINNKNNKYNQKSIKLFYKAIEENEKIKNKYNKLLNKQKELLIKIDKEIKYEKESETNNNIKISNINKNISKNKNINNQNKKQNSYKFKSKNNNNNNSDNSLNKEKKEINNKVIPLSRVEKNFDKNIFLSNQLQQNKDINITLRNNRSFNKFNEKLKSSINNEKKDQIRTSNSEKKFLQKPISKNNQIKKYINQANLIENYNNPNITDLLMKNKTINDTLNIFDNDYNEQIDKEKLNIRIIKLNNLLEIINQIYKIRNSRIEKQKEGVYNKATLEHDLYTYLKSKYGLKKLIIEWNINILSSIQSYIKSNGEVYLFALILRNELDEDSIEILDKIKKTVNNVLNLIYDYDINTIENIKKNKQFIKENEWKAISKCLYNDDNNLREKFENKISKFINNVMKGQELMAKTGKKIIFSDFMNILITYNIKLRKNYLHNLFILFSEQDKKRTGIINLEKFKIIIKNSRIIDDEQKVEQVINDLIEIADKEGSGQITFNDIVQCLDNLDLIIDEEKVKFLDKLSKMNFKK